MPTGIEPIFSAPITDSCFEDNLGYASIYIGDSEGIQTPIFSFRKAGHCSVMLRRYCIPTKIRTWTSYGVLGPASANWAIPALSL